MRVEVDTMAVRSERHRRPALADVLAEPTTPAALRERVHEPMIRRQQREIRAPEATAALRERRPDLATRTIPGPSPRPTGRWPACWSCPGTGARPSFVGDPPDWPPIR
jgi:hypothetical protein